MNRSGLILTAASATLLSLPASATATTTAAAPAAVPAPGTAIKITLMASPVLDIKGAQDPVTLTGSATLTAGDPVTLAGRPAIPFLISGELLAGYSRALGRVRMRLEGPQDAWLIEDSQAQPYPGEEMMPFNYDITIGEFPGETLTAQDIDPGPAILRNPTVTSFPPQGDVYQLVDPIDLEDVNNPGPVLATIMNFPVTVNPPTP